MELTNKQRLARQQAWVTFARFLVQVQARTGELLKAYEEQLDLNSENCIDALEKGVLRNMNTAMDMIPETTAIMEAYTDEMIAILSHGFNPGNMIAIKMETIYQDKEVPVHGMN